MIDVRTLEEEIGKIIEEELKEEKFKVHSEEEKREIKIYTGILPPDVEETIIPAITIRTTQAKNTLEQKKLTIKISIGIYDRDTKSGYEQISKITQMVFDTLIEKGVINERFEILPEAVWYHPEAQPIPYYLGFIELNIVYEKNYRKDYFENWLNGED